MNFFVVYDEGLDFQISYSINDSDTEKREMDAKVRGISTFIYIIGTFSTLVDVAYYYSFVLST